MTNVTKEQAEFDKFKESDTYALLVEYMSQKEANRTPWFIENRIWTAYRAGWLAAQEHAAREDAGPRALASRPVSRGLRADRSAPLPAKALPRRVRAEPPGVSPVVQFTLHKASDSSAEEIEVQTLEDLKALQDRYDDELIVDFRARTIWIRDDYME